MKLILDQFDPEKELWIIKKHDNMLRFIHIYKYDGQYEIDYYADKRISIEDVISIKTEKELYEKLTESCKGYNYSYATMSASTIFAMGLIQANVSTTQLMNSILIHEDNKSITEVIRIHELGDLTFIVKDAPII